MKCTKKEWNAYMREWRSRPGNQERQNKSSLGSFTRKKATQQEWINAYKMEKGCKVCGFRESPVALDFDHKDPNKKSFLISRKLGNLTLEKIKVEVEKCDVLCANHHRMRHFCSVGVEEASILGKDVA